MTAHAKIGLVCPSYGYPGFLPELAASILNQKTSVPFCAVLVDDCCPDSETIELCNEYAFAYPELFHYIRPRHNAGLSAVRNQGVNYLLSEFPDIEGITFLDADDRIFPLFVERSYHALCDAKANHQAKNTKVGWVFEDPYMIGIPGVMRRLRKHSFLWNMVGATQTSSSIMSAEMFRSGLRYAEDMKYGGEDWEFSLRAYKAGFRAYYRPTAGLRYRRRPGSMSASAAASLGMERNRADIRLRHPDIFQAISVNVLYAEECRHYCLITEDKKILLTSGLGDDGELITLDRLLQMLSDSCSIPASESPQVFVFTHSRFLKLLQKEKRLLDFAARLNQAANNIRITHHRFFAPCGDGTPRVFERLSAEEPSIADNIGAITMSREGFLSLVNGAEAARPQILDWKFSGDSNLTRFYAEEIVDTTVMQAQDSWSDGIRPAYRTLEQVWKPGGMDWRELPAMLTGIVKILPEPSNLRKTLILTPGEEIARNAGLDELLSLGQQIKDAGEGRKPALAIVGSAKITPEILDLFDAIYLVPPISGLTSSHYWGDEGLVASIASSFGNIISLGAMRLNTQTAILRKNGIGLYHRLYRNSEDFEHGRVIASMFKAYNGFITEDAREKKWLVAHGVPVETVLSLKDFSKILAV